MPVDQRQYDQLMSQLRSMGHIMERTPGNIGEVLRTGSSRAYVTETLHADGYAAVPTDAAPHRSTFDGVGNGIGWNVGNTTWNTNTYTSYDADGYDSGTDSDTASSCGDRDYDYSDVAHLSEEVQQQELFWAMEHAKGRWRQFSRKPVRKVRRFFRRTMKGKGKGKSGKRVSGKGVSTFTMNLTDEEYEEMYFGKGKGKGKGKSKGKRSSGKGAGRKGNPKGRDGRVMECFTPGCGSTTHLQRDCPTANTTGKGKGRPSSSSPPTTTMMTNYVEDYQSLYMIEDEIESPCSPNTPEASGHGSQEVPDASGTTAVSGNGSQEVPDATGTTQVDVEPSPDMNSPSTPPMPTTEGLHDMMLEMEEAACNDLSRRFAALAPPMPHAETMPLGTIPDIGEIPARAKPKGYAHGSTLMRPPGMPGMIKAKAAPPAPMPIDTGSSDSQGTLSDDHEDVVRRHEPIERDEVGARLAKRAKLKSENLTWEEVHAEAASSSSQAPAASEGIRLLDRSGIPAHVTPTAEEEETPWHEETWEEEPWNNEPEEPWSKEPEETPWKNESWKDEPEDIPQVEAPWQRKKTRRGTKARTPAAMDRRSAKRLDVELEEYQRNCGCPPWADHLPGCSMERMKMFRIRSTVKGEDRWASRVKDEDEVLGNEQHPDPVEEVPVTEETQAEAPVSEGTPVDGMSETDDTPAKNKREPDQGPLIFKKEEQEEDVLMTGG